MVMTIYIINAGLILSILGDGFKYIFHHILVSWWSKRHINVRSAEVRIVFGEVTGTINQERKG